MRWASAGRKSDESLCQTGTVTHVFLSVISQVKSERMSSPSACIQDDTEYERGLYNHHYYKLALSSLRYG